MRASPIFSVAWRLVLAILLGAAFIAVPAQPVASASTPVSPSGQAAVAADIVATFSIVAFDPDTGDLGVAVQSKFFAVGRVVPFARAGVGAVATQSLANTTYGPRGLEMLAAGTDPGQAIDALLADDPQRNVRQVGMIDAGGQAANFTGDACLDWAGGRIGENYAVQGNILAGPEVVDAMAMAFENTSGDLATRMVAALAAGQDAGGDIRGRQSAALLVVREGAGYGGFDDRFVDLRVDDHEAPIQELARLLDIHEAQLASDNGERAMRAAAGAAPAEQAALLNEALAAFGEATRRDPNNGWHWLSLATAQLAAGDRAAASAAGIEALRADPWVKAGVLRGFGSLSAVEQLLGDDAFRAEWEKVTTRFRAP